MDTELDHSYKNNFDRVGLIVMASFIFMSATLTSAYSQPPMPSIFCGAVHSFVCTPEQAIAEQRRQMQRRDSSTRSEGQQAYARWFYLQQMQRQRMEQEALVPNGGLRWRYRWQAGLLIASIGDALLLFVCLRIGVIVQRWHRHTDFEKGTSYDTRS